MPLDQNKFVRMQFTAGGKRGTGKKEARHTAQDTNQIPDKLSEGY